MNAATTIGAELESPAKFCWISALAGDRLGAVRLPARTRERRLDLRREHGEHDRDRRPGERDRSQVVGCPAAETTDRPDRLRMLVSAGDTGAAAATTTSSFLP